MGRREEEEEEKGKRGEGARVTLNYDRGGVPPKRYSVLSRQGLLAKHPLARSRRPFTDIIRAGSGASENWRSRDLSVF